MPLRGLGYPQIDGETVDFEPGRYVLVQPSATRQAVAGPEGLSSPMIGARVQGETG